MSSLATAHEGTDNGGRVLSHRTNDPHAWRRSAIALAFLGLALVVALAIEVARPVITHVKVEAHIVKAPHYVVASPPLPTWGVGACVADSTSGQKVYPVSCSQPHLGVITAVATSEYDCPYYSNYTSSYNAHATYANRDNKTYCYVMTDVQHP